MEITFSKLLANIPAPDGLIGFTTEEILIV